MRFSEPAGGFGIKKRSWFGDGRRRRPAFIEPLPRDGGGAPRSGGDVNEVTMDELIEMRRRELNGPDITFTETLTIMVIAGFIMLFILAASPWGIPPPSGGRSAI